jgi:hypothetical protein
MELPGHRPGASRKGNFIFIVPPDPARAGLVGHLPTNIPARPPRKSFFSYLLSCGFWGRESDRNTSKNLRKLLGQRPGLPGKVISFYIVPLDPAHSARLAGHVPAKRTILFLARGNRRYRFVAGSMDLNRDPTISDQRIPL